MGGCPCCDFDLFLPPPRQEENNGKEKDAEGLPPLCGPNDSSPMDPKQALEMLVMNAAAATAPLCLMDTHGHAHLERDRDETYQVVQDDDLVHLVPLGRSGLPDLRAIVCAGEPADWQTTLNFAARSNCYLPALGIHPWYLGDHERLPHDWMTQLEDLLVDHPSAIVGEIGLCKMARRTRQYPGGKAAAMELQRTVFRQQLEVAARLQRPVSVHCVDQHGILVSVLHDILVHRSKGGDDHRSCLPPTIAMHSFTGTAHQAMELLKWEDQLESDNRSPLFYFGFSHTVNYVMNHSEKARRKGRDTVRSIPMNRLMVESDVHSSQDLLGGTLGAVAYVAWARDETIHHVANVTSENGMRFLTAVQKSASTAFSIDSIQGSPSLPQVK